MRVQALCSGLFVFVLVSLIAGFSSSTAAQESATANLQLETKHLDKLGLTVEQVKPTAIDGLLEITTNQGVLYISADGTRLISGGMFDISGETAIDETTPSVEAMRKTQIEAMADTTILYAAENEQHRITVFTDISCGYCRQLHQRMDDYLAAGISIQYMAFPRNGLNDEVFEQMETIWCSESPQRRMDAAKSGRTLKTTACDSPVAKHYALAKQFGITGTPAAVTADGVLLSGFRPPELMLKDLAETAAARAAN